LRNLQVVSVNLLPDWLDVSFGERVDKVTTITVKFIPSEFEEEITVDGSVVIPLKIIVFDELGK